MAHRLDQPRRQVLEAGIASGRRLSEIGKEIGFSLNTICRELSRNTATGATYNAMIAQKMCEDRRKSCRLAVSEKNLKVLSDRCADCRGAKERAIATGYGVVPLYVVCRRCGGTGKEKDS